MLEDIIREEFKKVTRSTLDEIDVKNFIQILKKIKSKKMIMIAGSQGSGKSTLSIIIKNIFKKKYNKIITVISIDDFYLSINKRKELSKKEHNLFKTRGVPGTHDLTLLKEVLKKLKNNNYPIYLPKFDKIKDSKKVNKKKISCTDYIILEGWCVGARPLPKSYLFKNINRIESKLDKQKIWRKSYNDYLEKYQEVFKMFNLYIFLLTPSWKHVIEWKYKQELKIRHENKNSKLLRKLEEFILYYEKITRWMMKTSKLDCDILINLDSKQKFKKIIYK